MKSIKLSEIANGIWKERAIYTAEERAIPSVIDGLKPVQRFLLYSGFKHAPNSGNVEKVAAVASVVARYGYHHGETSAAAALTNMAAGFSNNLPLFIEKGNFGNILDPTPAQPRYIFTKLSPYIKDLIKDTDLSPVHEDEEHLPPKRYLPIIPMVLVNGVKGVATGYATDIPPHCPLDIIDIMIDMTNGKSSRAPIPKYYNYNATVIKQSDSYVMNGKFCWEGANKIRVSSLSYGNTVLNYESVLQKLLEKGAIVEYENESSENLFNFLITLKRGVKWTPEQVIKNLKLETKHTWNLTTTDFDGKIRKWDSYEEIIQAFYDYRINFIEKRIHNEIDSYKEKIQYYNALIKFIFDVDSGTYSMKNTSDEDIEKDLLNKYNFPVNRIKSVLNMPLRTLSASSLTKHNDNLHDAKQNLEYYEQTTPNIEYRKDLETLKKSVQKYFKENS